MRCRSALSCAVSRRFLVLSAPLALQVIPTPLHVLGRISPIFSPFFPVQHRFSGLAGEDAQKTRSQPKLTPGVGNAWQAALAIWHTTLFNMLMAEFNAEQVAGCADQASAPPLALAPAGPNPRRLFRWSK